MQSKKDLYKEFLNNIEHTLFSLWAKDDKYWKWFNKFSDYIDVLRKDLDKY